MTKRSWWLSALLTTCVLSVAACGGSQQSADGGTGDGDNGGDGDDNGGDGKPEACDSCAELPPPTDEPCKDGSKPITTCVKLDSGSCGYTEPECPASGDTCGTRGAEDCPSGEYCALDSQCGKDDGGGTCETVPSACTKERNPVCGCDGITYDNACLAAKAGMSVAKNGDCNAETCGGLAGGSCDDGQYCDLADNCLAPDPSGVCANIPDSCPAIFMPVCGCNGKTYGSDCEAAANGQSVAHEGECESTTPGDCDTCEGPMPGIPSVLCPDGVHMSGPACLQGKDGCEWGLTECPGQNDHCRQASPPAVGECWDDSDCEQGSCLGASCCPVNADCIVADMPGHCQ